MDYDPISFAVDGATDLSTPIFISHTFMAVYFIALAGEGNGLHFQRSNPSRHFDAHRSPKRQHFGHHKGRLVYS